MFPSCATNLGNIRQSCVSGSQCGRLGGDEARSLMFLLFYSLARASFGLFTAKSRQRFVRFTPSSPTVDDLASRSKASDRKPPSYVHLASHVPAYVHRFRPSLATHSSCWRPTENITSMIAFSRETERAHPMANWTKARSKAKGFPRRGAAQHLTIPA